MVSWPGTRGFELAAVKDLDERQMAARMPFVSAAKRKG
jgi:hypothetical protein